MGEEYTSRVKENVSKIKLKIIEASNRAGRDPSAVRLLAAGKNRSASQVLEAWQAGVDYIGENRVQELLKKIEDVREAVEWHFIGHLQTNKVKHVVGRVSLIHSVDSLRLASEISRWALKYGTTMPILFQVNVAGEKSKFGLSLQEAKDTIRRASELRNVEIKGLSTIAPLVSDSEEVRWVFRQLRKLRDDITTELGLDLPELSMGMSNDFEVAIEEGSTIVRIGTAIFSGSED